MTAALIVAFLQKFWMPILSVIVGAWWGWKQRKAGAASVRAEQAKAEQKARTIADEIDDAIAGREPGENRKELRTWSKS